MTIEFEKATKGAQDALNELWDNSDGMQVKDVRSALNDLVSSAQEMLADLQSNIPSQE